MHADDGRSTGRPPGRGEAARSTRRALAERRGRRCRAQQLLARRCSRPEAGGASDLRRRRAPAGCRPRRQRGTARRDGARGLILPDVNVLVYAHRQDADRHAEYRAWLESVVGAEQSYGIAELVLSGFLRIVTHPKVFTQPTPLPQAIAFCETVRSQPNAAVLSPGPRHWQIFTGLCAESGARGNLVPDAYLAALAIA